MTAGPPAGAPEDVLRHIAALIKTSLRTGDFVARFGGEEFMARLPDTDLDGARTVAEKIREAIQENPQSTIGTVTISVADSDALAVLRELHQRMLERGLGHVRLLTLSRAGTPRVASYEFVP